MKIKLGSHVEAKDGINRTALREIKLLQEFGHISSISIVMDFMNTDLEVIIKEPSIVLNPANCELPPSILTFESAV